MGLGVAFVRREGCPAEDGAQGGPGYKSRGIPEGPWLPSPAALLSRFRSLSSLLLLPPWLLAPWRTVRNLGQLCSINPQPCALSPLSV